MTGRIRERVGARAALLAARAVLLAAAALLACGVKAPPRPPERTGVEGTRHDLRPEGPGAPGGGEAAAPGGGEAATPDGGTARP